MMMQFSRVFEKNITFIYGAIAQLARALAWHARGREFESP